MCHLSLWDLSKVDVNVDIDNVDVVVKVLLVVGHQVPASVFAHVSALPRSPSVKRFHHISISSTFLITSYHMGE